ncbi:PAS domain S-box protein [Halopenitus salinus]|uniref:histidine kinase n=1 Tax=Halopenitus salinus TaxID=1198295 RepID=A0ABD5UTY3_9EURY
MESEIGVLHVDDQSDFGELVAAFLERVDDRIEVQTETSVTTALEKLSGDPDRIDCVVSDYDMPESNGLQFLEAVREEEPTLPFILFTGKGSEEVASEAIAKGATDYLQKRGGTEQYELLANRITNAVEQYRYEHERNRVYRALETATQAIGLIDEEGRYIYLNEAYANLYGYDPEELVGEHWRVLYPDEEVERFEEEILPRLEEEGRWTGQSRGLHADGTAIPERLSLARLDTGGHVCVVQDVSEKQRRRRRQRRQQDALLDLMTHESVVSGRFDRAVEEVTETATEVLDASAVNVWLLDEEDDVLRCVDEYDRIEDEHESGMTLDVDAYPEYVDAIRSNRSIAAEDARSDPRTRGLAGDYLEPNDVQSLLDATLRSEGEVKGVVCHETREEAREWSGDEVQFANDVADIVHRALRNRNDRERQRELEFQRSLLAAQRDAILDGLIVVNEDREIVSYNDRFCELWEIPEHVLERGDDDAVLERVSEKTIDPEAFREFIEELYAGPEATSRGEIELRDGRIFDRYTTPVTGEDGNYYGRLWMFRDVTDRKQLERKLERQIEQFDELTSVVSHDLRSPMATVRGRLELARETGEVEHIEAALSALDRADELRADLETVLKTGEIVDETRSLEVDELARSVWETIDTSATQQSKSGTEVNDSRGEMDDSSAVGNEEGGATSHENTEASASLHVEGPIDVRGDESAVRRLFENLIGNSIEHGEGTVRIRIGPLRGEDGFYLEDDGPGIPPENRERVFVPGFSTKVNGEGIGIGMASVHQIIEEHDWEIEVTDATELGGVRFEINTAPERGGQSE